MLCSTWQQGQVDQLLLPAKLCTCKSLHSEVPLSLLHVSESIDLYLFLTCMDTSRSCCTSISMPNLIFRINRPSEDLQTLTDTFSNLGTLSNVPSTWVNHTGQRKYGTKETAMAIVARMVPRLMDRQWRFSQGAGGRWGLLDSLVAEVQPVSCFAKARNDVDGKSTRFKDLFKGLGIFSFIYRAGFHVYRV